MPRYINENDVYKLVEPTGKASVHCSQIDALPRADAVPRAEVAKEIFAEIDILVDDYKYSHIQSIQFIAELSELKKKYTED